MNQRLRDNFMNMRKKVGLSQTQLANFLEMDQSSVSKFEKGERSLELNALEKACTIFGCTLKDLQSNNQDNCIKMSFRRTNLTKNTLNQIASVNRIALNLLEMKELEGELDA